MENVIQDICTDRLLYSCTLRCSFCTDKR